MFENEGMTFTFSVFLWHQLEWLTYWLAKENQRVSISRQALGPSDLFSCGHSGLFCRMIITYLNPVPKNKSGFEFQKFQSLGYDTKCSETLIPCCCNPHTHTHTHIYSSNKNWHINSDEFSLNIQWCFLANSLYRVTIKETDTFNVVLKWNY
jgi:hypothetical protein